MFWGKEKSLGPAGIGVSDDAIVVSRCTDYVIPALIQNLVGCLVARDVLRKARRIKLVYIEIG